MGTKPDEGYTAGGWDVTPSAGTAIEKDTTYTYTYAGEAISRTVTFVVENGSWDDGTADAKPVTLEGLYGDKLTLAADQIPAVGTKPDEEYKAGGWDVTPSADTEIKENTTYTYTYDKKEAISRTVMFAVENGSWDDGTADAKPVTLEGLEGDTLTLAADQIPAVGKNPADEYKEGDWDVTPVADTEIEKDTTYTYTYIKQGTISRKVIFKVVNGKWDDKTTKQKTVTLTGLEKSPLTLAADQIPAVGNQPADGYKEGSWDGDLTLSINKSGTTFTYTYAPREKISRTVTFTVDNGTWSDGTDAKKTVTLEGLEGDTLKLAEAQIPAVGGNPDEGYREGSWNVTPSADTEIIKNTVYSYTYAKREAISHTVTFKVENGSWDDGTADEITVTLEGLEGDTLRLAADQIPGAGNNPAEGYKAGSWDTAPSADTAIAADTVYTYTYAEREAISYTVTFEVENGSWDDGTADEITVTLEGLEGDTLTLAADQIPGAGSKPDEGYKAGGWDTAPSADTEIAADTVYTYSYAEQEQVTRTVTFRVVNGRWNDGTKKEKTITLTGPESGALKLAADRIPAVSGKPAKGYREGGWDVTPSGDTEIAADTVFTYTYAEKEAISYTVTFEVENGSWDDGTADEITVTLEGLEGDTLKLAADQIPGAGSNPDKGYKAGNWEPETDTEIEEDTTFTYTYAEKEAISYTVTFEVENGSWDDGTADEITVTLEGLEGDALTLAADQIPLAGSNPDEEYKAGGWDVTPAAGAEIAADTVFTYTYAEQEQVIRTVTFRVVNGRWNDGTADEKTLTVSGPESSALKLAAGRIPAAGGKPANGYKAGRWDVTPSADTEIEEDTVFTYTYARKEQISRTVTFRVVNGSWDDGTSADRRVILTGRPGDSLELALDEIPSAGMKPDQGYMEGSWDVAPYTNLTIKQNTVFIYTYDAERRISLVRGLEIVGLREYYYYTGAAIKPAFRVEDNGLVLRNGTDYTVTYKNNLKVGTATVNVKGKGNYKSTVTTTFEIRERPQTEAGSLVEGVMGISKPAKRVYNGLPQYPETLTITVKNDGKKEKITATHLGNGLYSTPDNMKVNIVVSNNIYPSSGVVMAVGANGNKNTKFFSISKAPMTDIIIPKSYEVEYCKNKKNMRPENLGLKWKNGAGEIVDLMEGQDYQVSVHKDHIKIKGKGYFKGNVKVPLTVRPFEPKTIDAVEANSKVEASKVKVTILDSAGEALPNKFFNVKVLDEEGNEVPGKTKLTGGTYTIVVTSKKNDLVYIDEKGLRTTVTVGNKLSSASVNAKNLEKITYTGKPIELTKDQINKISVQFKKTPLVYGEDFVIYGYRNNIQAGTMYVTLKGTEVDNGRGVFTGTKVIKIKIVKDDLGKRTAP